MLKIRDATIDDLSSILDIYNDAVLNLTATFDLVPQTIEERKVWFNRFGGKYPLLVGEWDNEIVGYCSLSSFREKPAYSQTAELSIYLDKNHRGKGIGPTMMKELLNRAVDLDFHVIVAGITDGNEASVKLHEKFGFELVGCFKEVGFKFGEWQSVSFYQLLLK